VQKMPRLKIYALFKSIKFCLIVEINIYMLDSTEDDLDVSGFMISLVAKREKESSKTL
jgi:hypothetical protein